MVDRARRLAQLVREWRPGPDWLATSDAQMIADSRMHSRIGGLVAASLSGFLLVVATTDLRGEFTLPFVLAIGVAGLAAVLLPRYGERLPVVALDLTEVATAAVLFLVTASGGLGRVIAPAIYVVLGTAVMAQRSRPIAGFHVALLGVSYGAGLAVRPPVEAPLTRWLGVMAAIITCGAFVRMIMNAIGTLAVSERRDLAVAEAAATDLAAANQAKTDFLGRMSHELRTPLNAVIGFADVLRAEFSGPLTGEQRTFVDDISDSGRHLLALVDEVLDVSKVENGDIDLEIEEVDLIELVDACVTPMRRTAVRHGVVLSETAGMRSAVARIDAQRVRQVLLNLLANAIRFSEPGGHVGVRIDHRHDRLLVSVTDTGPGVAPGDAERIFEPFQQAHDSHDGTGLGLALSRRYVEAHGGHLFVRSEASGGATFAFDLPFEPLTRPSRMEPLPAPDGLFSAHAAFTQPGSAANRALIARSGAWFATSAGALAFALAVTTPASTAARVMLACVGVAGLGASRMLLHFALVIPYWGIDALGIAGSVALTCVVWATPGFMEVTTLAYLWSPLVGFALWPYRRSVRHLVIVAVGFGLVLRFGPAQEWPWARWFTLVMLVCVGSAMVAILVGELRRTLSAHDAARAAAVALQTKLAAATQHKSEFLASMSHEMRTPLNAIIGFADVLAEGYGGELSDEQRAYVTDISDAGHQLLVLVNDVLDLAKLEADLGLLGDETVSLRTLAEASVDRASAEAAARGILVELCGSDAAHVVGEGHRLSRAIDNLVANAVKFTPDGGRVSVALAFDGPPDRREVSLRVSDTGIGIDPDTMSQIFNPFEQASGPVPDHAAGGYGLGLALAQRIARRHGGSIDVESGVALGSVFTLRLPAQSDRQPDRRNSTSAGAGS